MSDFFEPGFTYMERAPFCAPELTMVFRCAAVAVHPAKGEPRAFGFDATAYPGDNWQSAAYGPGMWDRGWIKQEAKT